MNKRWAKNTIIVATITLISKILGFLRDTVLAYFYGANGVSDAYLVAQTIPEFAFSLVIQAIAVGYIPIYSELKSTGDEGNKEAKKFTDILLSDTYLLCIVLIIIINLFPRQFVGIFASGFTEETTLIAVKLVRIIVIAMLGKSTVSIIGAFLQSNDDFAVNAFTGIPFDIIVVISIALSSIWGEDILGWGFLFAVMFQAVMISIRARKFQYKFKPQINFTSTHIKKMFSLFLPVCIGVGANQINLIVDRTLASTVSIGGISAMNYANKVDNIMENIIVLSLAAVMYPAFAKYAAEKNYKMLGQVGTTTLNTVCAVMAPIAAGTMLFAYEIVEILFGHGAFDQAATHLTAQAMSFYSIGVVFTAWRAILTRIFYSAQKVNIVTVNSCIAIAVNIVCNLILVRPMGISGLALATSLSSIVAVILMMISLKKLIHVNYKYLTIETVKVTIAVLIMSLWCYFSYTFMQSVMDMHMYIAMAISVVSSALVYLAFSLILNIQGIKKVFKLVKHDEGE